jgi:hypothetical protein
MMGLAAGCGGTGKRALVKFLRAALDEALDSKIPVPQGEHPDIHAVHAAWTAYFAADRAHYQKTIQKYADLMQGGHE